MKDKDTIRKKEELRRVIYEEEYPDITEKVYKKREKKPIFTNIILSLMLVCGLFFSIFLVLDSSNRINELYEIINAILFFLVVLGIVISFPKTFFKKKTGSTIYLSFMIILTIIFNSLYLFQIIKLPQQSHIIDYANKNLTLAADWLDDKKINYEESFEYSESITKYNIISQNVKPGTLTKNIKDIKLTVSKGPDYNKEVIIPDQTGLKTDNILEFIDKNFLKNVQIVFEENEEIENDIIIRQSSTGKIKRNDSYIYTASLGKKDTLKPIKMKKLEGEKLLNAEVYLGKNGITYELKYEFSKSTSRGCIISTDVKEGTTLNPDDKVVLTVSKGKEIKVPNLKGKSLKNVNKWIIENNLDIEYSDKYDDKIKKGHAISSNYNIGSIIEEETLVSIIFSKGKLILPKFKDLASFKTWASTYNINYEIKEEFSSDIPKDGIIKFSVKEGKKIDLNTPLIVYVSKGESIKVTEFTGKSKNEAQKECDNLGIQCSFFNTLSDKEEGIVLSQSIAAGLEIAKGDTINIELSTKKQEQVTPKKSTQSSQNIPNKSTNNKQAPSSDNQQNTCTNQTYITASGNNGEQSIVLMKKYNPNLKLSFTEEKACSNGSTTSGSICYAQNLSTGTTIYDGNSVSSCDNINVHYIK